MVWIAVDRNGLQSFPVIRTDFRNGTAKKIPVPTQLIGIWDRPLQQQFQLKPLSGSFVGISTRLSQGYRSERGAGFRSLWEESFFLQHVYTAIPERSA